MALEEAIHIDVDTNAGEAEKKLDKFNEELKKTGEGAQQAEKKIIPLKTQLRQLRDQLAGMEEGSPAFIELAKKAGDLQGQIEAANNTAKLFKDSLGEQQLAGVIGTLELVTAGFGAIQGAQALLGAESEDLQKVLAKVNATMLVLNGLQSIQANLQKDSAAYIFITTNAQKLYDSAVKASTLSTTAFNTALAATGIGLAVIAVTYLPDIIDSFKEENKEVSLATQLQEQYNTTLSETATELIKERAAVEANLLIAQDKNRSDKERNAALSEAIKQQPQYLQGLTLENLETEKGVKILQAYRAEFQKLVRSKAAEKQLIDIETQLLTLEQARFNPEELRKSARAEADRISALGASNSEYQKVLKDGLATANVLITEQATKEKALLEQREFLLKQIDFTQTETSTKTVKGIKDVTTAAAVETERLVDMYEAISQLQTTSPGPDYKTSEQRQQEYYDELLRQGEEFLAKEQAIFEGRQQLYSISSELFSNLTQLVAVEGKNMTDLQKAFALVQIGIDTARALSSALSATYATTPEPIAAAIKYATIAANIFATAAKIKNVLKSGASISSAAAPTGGNISQPQQPPATTTAAPIVQNNITITERDLRRAALNAAERNRGAVVVV